MPNNDVIMSSVYKLHFRTLQRSQMATSPLMEGYLIFKTDEAGKAKSADARCKTISSKLMSAVKTLFMASEDTASGFQMKTKIELAKGSFRLFQRCLDLVRKMRLKSPKKLTKDGAATPHAFQQKRQVGNENLVIVPKVSSERRRSRPYLP